MALRYLARRVGVPALRQPSVSPSTAGSRPLTSSPFQVGYSNGTKVDAPMKCEGKITYELALEEVAMARARFHAAREAIKEAKRREKMHTRCVVGSGVAGMFFALYVISSVARGAKVDCHREKQVSSVGYSNGTKVDAPMKWKGRIAYMMAEEEVAIVRAEFQAVREAIKQAKRREKIDDWCVVGSGVAGMLFGLYIISAVVREEGRLQRAETGLEVKQA
ncbi:hypothetical protein ACP70R_015258 [Stipagrostis hirtigluma subsp. patula]